MGRRVTEDGPFYPDEEMSDRLIARLSGTCVLLSLAAEIAAIAVSASHGLSPARANAMNWGVGEQLVFFQAGWLRTLFALAIIAPCLSMLAWLAMYPVMAPGGPAALPGVIVTSFGFLLGVLAEMIRFSVTSTLPNRYLAAPEGARPAVLALGGFLTALFQILAMISLILVFAVGVPLVVSAIFRGRIVPRWLGWALIIPSVVVGYVGGPLLLLGYSIGGAFVGLGLNVFFVAFLVVGILLLRWQPAADRVRDISRT